MTNQLSSSDNPPMKRWISSTDCLRFRCYTAQARCSPRHAPVQNLSVSDCAVPVIYAAVGEAAELLEAHKCGIVVKPEEPALLAQAISSLASDHSMRHTMGCAGRAFVEREYSWSTIIERWLTEVGLSQGSCMGSNLRHRCVGPRP